MHNAPRQPLDKGFIKVVIGKYHKKQNGQPLYNGQEPVMGNRYTTIGEVTRWPNDNGGTSDKIEFYPGFTILDTNKDGMIFWESHNQTGQQPQQPQQPPPHQGHYQQSRPSR